VPLAKTTRAIGAVTEAIKARLQENTLLDVSVGRPEPPNGGGPAGARLNLFLYEVDFDANLKNVPLDEGQRPPLWLVLKYLMTAFAKDGNNSDSSEAHENLGLGINALQQLALLPFDVSDPLLDSLRDNPEDLTITFDDAPIDLISKVMQGSDEKYRLSIAFQVRPVMIATAELPSYSQLVGVNYETMTLIGEKGIRIPVLPSMGPTLDEVSPLSFELNDTVTLKGSDLHLANLSVHLGPVELPVTMQQPDRLQFVVRPDIATPALISAGGHPISVTQLISTGRQRKSNPVVGSLRPTVTNVVRGPVSTVGTLKFATIDVTGTLLGKDGSDEFYLALIREGMTVRLFDVLADTSSGAQTGRRCVMQAADAVPSGSYLVIYRVNGQQATQAFTINLV